MTHAYGSLKTNFRSTKDLLSLYYRRREQRVSIQHEYVALGMRR